MTDNINSQLEIDALKQEMLRMSARLDALTESIEAADDGGYVEDEIKEPVRRVAIGSGLAGGKYGDLLTISGVEFDESDINYHFKIITEIGNDATSATGNQAGDASGVTIIDGTWTRNATNEVSATYTPAGLSLSNAAVGKPPDAIADPLAPIDMGLDSDFSADGKYYIYLQLLPDINSISDGEPDPNLLPNDLGAFAVLDTAWVTGVLEGKYGHNTQKILGSVTIASNLVTDYEQYWTGGNIDDTCFIPDVNTNAWTDGTTSTDDDVAYSLEFNTRGEGQIREIHDASNNTVSSVDYLIGVDGLGGPSTDRNRVIYITPADITSSVDWCDLTGDTTNPCFDTIVDEIVTEINDRGEDGSQSGETGIIHSQLEFTGSSNSILRGENVDHDRRYWMAMASKDPGHAHSQFGQDNGNYETSGNVSAEIVKADITDAGTGYFQHGTKVGITAGDAFSGGIFWQSGTDPGAVTAGPGAGAAHDKTARDYAQAIRDELVAMGIFA